MWIIRSGKYYLSNEYSKALEPLLGYGGVYTTNYDEVKFFKTKDEALKELKLIKRVNGYAYMQEVN